MREYSEMILYSYILEENNPYKSLLCIINETLEYFK